MRLLLRSLPLLLLCLCAPSAAVAAPVGIAGNVISYGDGAAHVNVTLTATHSSCGAGCVATTATFTGGSGTTPVAGAGCVADAAVAARVTCSLHAPSIAEVRVVGGPDSDFVDASASTISPVAAMGAGDDALIWCACLTGTVSIDGGAGANDSLNFERAATGVKLTGAVVRGVEVLAGTPFADVFDVPVATIYAGAGNDVVRAGALAQRIFLEEGHDVFVEQQAKQHAHTVKGGAGRDRYEATGTAKEAFEICLDDRIAVCPVFDGRTGEKDSIGSDVEDVRMRGTSHDLLIGSRDANTLEGGGGNDIMAGGQGADTFKGGAGLDLATYGMKSIDPRGVSVTFDGRRNDGNPRTDFIHADVEIAAGTHANDRLTGGRGLDALFGGEGNDHIVGGKGPDLLVGGPGNDYINARDGVRDEIDCGPGSDRIRADLFDKIKRDCEFRRFS